MNKRRGSRVWSSAECIIIFMRHTRSHSSRPRRELFSILEVYMLRQSVLTGVSKGCLVAREIVVNSKVFQLFSLFLLRFKKIRYSPSVLRYTAALENGYHNR